MSAAKGTTKSAKQGAVYVCQTCAAQGIDSRYSRIEFLHRHERTHSESKPFVCEYCNKRYARSDVLFRHRKKCTETPKEGDSNKNSRSRVNVDEPTPSHRVARGRARGSLAPYSDTSLVPSNTSIPQSSRNISSVSSLLPSDSDERSRAPPTEDGARFDQLLPGTSELLPFPEFLIGSDLLSGTDEDSAGLPNLAFSLRSNNYPPWEEPVPSDSGWPAPAANALDTNPFSTEPTFMLAQNNLFRELRGQCEVDPSNPFFFDATRVMYCYMVPKWNMPNATKMSALAYRTFNTVVEHLGVVHMPTFRLEDAHNWLIFAMCTTAPRPESDLRVTTPTNYGENPVFQRALDEIDQSPEWPQSQDLIRREKTDVLVKSFYQTTRGRKLTATESLPLIHALLLYNSSSFLSENQKDRLAGELFLGTITTVARQSGLFNPGSTCTRPDQIPVQEWPLLWRKWISHETWRRTAWLVYTLDTLALLETNATAHVPPRDIRHIPVPYPDWIWKAPTAKKWSDALAEFGWTTRTLDDGMYCLASPVHNPASVRIFRGRLGPYARHTLILTILRGLVAYGRGEPSGGYVTKRWVLAGPNGERLGPLENVTKHRYIIATYHRMLDYWRQSWDFDVTCQLNHGGVYFINDALPPYWLCRMILGHLTPLPPPYVPFLRSGEDTFLYSQYPGGPEEDGPDRLATIDLKDMLNVARRFVSNGEGAGMPSAPGASNPFFTSFNTASPGPWSSTGTSVPPEVLPIHIDNLQPLSINPYTF